MTAPKPTPPKSKSVTSAPQPRKNRNPKQEQAKKEAAPKKEFTPQDHMTHRPFAEALKDFFKKETN